MNHIVIEKKINNKVVRCIFIFKKYSERDFKDDFEEFVQLQTGKKKIGDFVEFHKYNLTQFTEIPYNYFIEYGTKLFSETMFNLLKQRPDFILSDELNIQISFRSIKDLDYYFATVDKSINAENACFIAAGTWFLFNIVAPYFYFKKFEFSIIIRYFLHELTHYVDMVQKHLSWDINRNYETKIRNIVGRKSAYGINYLYNSLFNLREEGLADFIARCESPEMDISGDAMRIYNSNLRKLAFMRYKKDASKFYFDKISHGNLTPTGEYSTGRNMCLVVAMSISKEIKSPFTVRVNKEKSFGYNFNDFDHYLSKGVTIYVSGIHKDIIARTIALMRPTNHYYFLKVYEKACDVMGISDKNRAMTQRRFFKLVQEAKEISKSQNKRLIEKGGFVYVQSDLPLS